MKFSVCTGGCYFLRHWLLFIQCSILLFASVPNVAVAQDADLKPRHIQLGVGYTLPKFLDESSSALQYQGHAGSVTAGLHWANPDGSARHVGNIRFDYGQMAAFEFEFADVNFFRFEGNYRYEKRIRTLLNDRVRWFVGGSFGGLWTLWEFTGYSNNAFNNSFYFSLSPHTTLEYPFRLWNRRFQVSYAAFVPLLTLAMRPSYGTTLLPEFLDDERDEPVQQFLGSGQFASLNRLFRYSNTLALEYSLRNTNRLRLSYTWNYVRYDEPRLVQSASHNITLSTMFNF